MTFDRLLAFFVGLCFLFLEPAPVFFWLQWPSSSLPLPLASTRPLLRVIVLCSVMWLVPTPPANMNNIATNAFALRENMTATLAEVCGRVFADFRDRSSPLCVCFVCVLVSPPDILW